MTPMPEEKTPLITEHTRLRVPSVNAKGELLIENIPGNNAVICKIGKEQVTVRTGDLATVLMTVMPPERVAEIFSECESKSVEKGKVLIQLVAKSDIKTGDSIVATLDITRYVDRGGMPTGIRTTPSGIMF